MHAVTKDNCDNHSKVQHVLCANSKLNKSFIHSFILNIYIAPLQRTTQRRNYSEAFDFKSTSYMALCCLSSFIMSCVVRS